jgi:hypothetical protein
MERWSDLVEWLRSELSCVARDLRLSVHHLEVGVTEILLARSGLGECLPPRQSLTPLGPSGAEAPQYGFCKPQPTRGGLHRTWFLALGPSGHRASSRDRDLRGARVLRDTLDRESGGSHLRSALHLTHGGLGALKQRGLPGHPLGKNPGDVWTISAANFRGAHFATFPVSLIDRPIRATTPERVCDNCRQPWLRHSGRLIRQCRCRSAAYRPGIVLDPFMGSGTVGVVARRHRRHFVGIELSQRFASMARERIAKDQKEVK